MALLMGTLTLNAQPRQGGKATPEARQERRENMARIQALKIAEQLAFDEATTAKFTDTYLACQKEIWALGPGVKGDKPEVNSEKAAEEANKAQFERSEKVTSIRKKYYSEYSKFLTQKQIQRVYQIEKQMHERMANHKRGGRHGQRPGQGPKRN